MLPTPEGAAASGAVRLVLLPGSGVKAEEYAALAKVLQARCADRGMACHVAVAKFPRNNPFLAVFRNGVQRRIEALGTRLAEDAGPDAPLYVLGHSLGALVGIEAARVAADGFVSMGCVFNSAGDAPWKGRDASTYPKRLMHLLGGRDGYLRPSFALQELRALDAHTAFAPADASRHCVAILPNVNHEQMANGTRTRIAAKTGRFDLPPVLPLEEAHEEIASAVADFLAAPQAEDCRDRTSERTASAREMLSAMGAELGSEAVAAHARRCAAAASRGLLREEDVGVIIYDAKEKRGVDDFTYSKPYFDGDKLVVMALVGDGLALSGASPQVAPTVSLKLKSLEAIEQHLGAAASEGDGADVTARELSEAALAWALEQHGGAPECELGFGEDQVAARGPDWVAGQPAVAPSGAPGGGVAVSSPVIRTPLRGIPPRFAGMLYVKPLTRGQALEWLAWDAAKLAAADAAAATA